VIRKYRKKPVVIEALKYDGENFGEIMRFASSSAREFGEEIFGDGITIKTLEGEMTASKGDYIIKGVQGEFYPCKPDIFEQTYEEVNGE